MSKKLSIGGKGKLTIRDELRTILDSLFSIPVPNEEMRVSQIRELVETDGTFLIVVREENGDSLQFLPSSGEPHGSKIIRGIKALYFMPVYI